MLKEKDMINQPIKILMLEDFPYDAQLVERALIRDGLLFTAKCVDTREEFIEALSYFAPDIVLSDHSLPQFNSLEAYEICRDTRPNIPFIIVTGAVSEEFATCCLKKGADDYVLKDNLARLGVAIKTALIRKRGEEARKRTERMLQKQNEQLVKINKELDNFVYSVSHNLRAPLMSVLGLINLAQTDSGNKASELDIFAMMRSSINNLDQVLKDIIDYSRNSRCELGIKRIDLEQLIKSASSSLRYLNGYDDVSKTILVQGNNEFYSDPSRISVIASNLISNAIKYMDVTKKKKVMRIEVNVSGAEASMSFHDNGIGIAAEFLPKIFEMFYRATAVAEGSGLGLYIVKESILTLGGSIHVESTPSEGTTFNLRIPNVNRKVTDPRNLPNLLSIGKPIIS